MGRILFSPGRTTEPTRQPSVSPQPPERDFIDKASSFGRGLTSFFGGEKLGEFLGATIASTPLLGKFVTGIELTSEERQIVLRSAPSTTDVLKSAAGAVLQTGSFAIGGGAASAARLGLRTATVQGAKLGAAAGGVFEAGRAIGEGEDVGGIARATAIGVAFGGTVGLVFPAGAAGTASVYRFGANALRQVHQLIKPQTRDIAVSQLAIGLEKSFVVDNSSIRNALTKLATRSSRPGEKVTKEQLLKELAEDGYMPRVEGKLAVFDEAIEDMAERRQVMAEGLDAIFEKMPDKAISLDKFLERAKASLRSSPQAASTLNRALSEMDSIFASFRTKFGDKLTPLEVNTIRKEMNRVSKASKGELFVQDTADAVADAARNVIDDFLPSGVAKEANAEIGKLFRMEQTAKILNNKPINVGVLGGQLGRYIGVLGLGVAGGSAIVGGPGALVVAGIAAHIGGTRMASLLRSLRFNDRARQILIEGLQKDKDILNRLLQEASKEDAQYILRQVKLSLPPPSGRPLGVPEIRLPEKGVLEGQQKLREPFKAAGTAKSAIPKDLEPLAQEARKFNTAEKFANNTPNKVIDDLRDRGIRGVEQRMAFWKQATKGLDKTPILDDLNPTGGLFVDYTPKQRATIKLGDNITTLDKTSGKSPNTTITIYRGAPKNQKEIVPGDFITTSRELAESYTGDKNVLSKKVKMSDVLDDVTEPLGEEYIYRPKSQLTDIFNQAKKKL